MRPTIPTVKITLTTAIIDVNLTVYIINPQNNSKRKVALGCRGDTGLTFYHRCWESLIIHLSRPRFHMWEKGSQNPSPCILYVCEIWTTLFLVGEICVHVLTHIYTHNI